jgi:hypothetical protein
VSQQLAGEARKNLIARLRKRPPRRVEKHDLLFHPERVPLIELAVPACPQGVGADRVVGTPVDRVEIRAGETRSRHLESVAWANLTAQGGAHV